MAVVEESRPWGSFRVLYESDDCKVKIIEVGPGHRLSYQRHRKRAERWTVINGEATVVIDDEVSTCGKGSVVVVEKMQKHRLINESEEVLRIIEVQIGDYFGEDDIERFSDDYGRT